MVSAEVPLVFALAAAANVVGALVFFVLASRVRRAADATRSWPAITGHVTSSRLVPGRKTSAADVTYDYVVDGQTYTGTRVDVGHRVGGLLLGMSHGATQALLDRFSPGAEVVVFYDPRRPERAVLAPGEDSGVARRLVIMGGVALIVATIFAAVAWTSG